MRFLDLSRFRNAVSLSSGKHASLFSGEGIEFGGLRSYSETDDSRAIDWKASLRSGKTLVKTFVPDREIPVWTVIDVSAPMGFGFEGATRFDEALAVFELVSVSAIGAGNRAGAIAYSPGRVRTLRPTLSFAEIRRFVQTLREDFSEGASAASDEVPFRAVSEKIRTKSAVFFIADVHPRFPAGIRRALKGSHVFSLRISHPFDREAPACGIPSVSMGGRIARLFRKAAKPSAKPSVTDETDSLRSARIPFVEIEAGTDPFPALNRLLSNPDA